MARVLNGEISHWHEAATGVARPALSDEIEADVCIVGGGLTGLWTAYYVKRARPELHVVVLEARFVGFGASGRNGGWLSAAVPGSLARYARNSGREAVRLLQRAFSDTVGEVIAVAEREGIDADIARGGILRVATAPAQLERLRHSVAEKAGWGDMSWSELSAEEVAKRVRVAGVLGGAFSPNGAVLQPAKLVTGLGRTVEALGVRIYENSPVVELSAGRVRTRDASVRARFVLRATEGFTAALPGERRTLLPLNSSMLVTEPLGVAQWEEIGWVDREAVGDAAHAYVYAQRTADGRIAIGGRGIPCRYGSRTDREGRTQRWTIRALERSLLSLFPSVSADQIAHAWSGVLGIPRDWCAGVGLDPTSGLGLAGGYVGSGLAASNLAGRTLRDLILGETSGLAELPWVGRVVRRWEPEPLRWLGVQATYLAYRTADGREAKSRGHTSRLARVADRVTGKG